MRVGEMFGRREGGERKVRGRRVGHVGDITGRRRKVLSVWEGSVSGAELQAR